MDLKPVIERNKQNFCGIEISDFKLFQPDDKEWIALWVEVPKEKPEVPYHRRGKRDLLNSTYSISDDFVKDEPDRLELLVIGDNGEQWQDGKVNFLIA